MPETIGYEIHPCEHDGCQNEVAYDDEPYCFTHSPDSGSTVPGYSYKDPNKDIFF